MKISIVMPCLNEAETLAICIQKANAWIANSGLDCEVIIADNGSTDGSQDIALANGAKVVPVAARGYGSALYSETIAVGPNKKMMPVSSPAKLYIAGGFNGTTYAQASAIDVAEVLIYDGAVPNAGLTTVWNYFKTKYGFIN